MNEPSTGAIAHDSSSAGITPGADSPGDDHRTDLATKLGALLADLAKLEKLDRLDLEPATPWPWREEDDDRR
jgi:hypothetical protein